MKKLLISFILVVTAFLGANLLRFNTYAATSPEVSFVTVGNRIYVEIADATDATHGIIRNNLVNEYSEKTFSITIPEGIRHFYVVYGGNTYKSNDLIENNSTVIDVALYENITFDSDSGMGLFWGEVPLYNVDDDFTMYFEIQSTIKASDAEFVTVGNRAYLAFNGETLIDTANIDPTESIFEIDIPDNVTNLIIADETNSIRYNWANTENETISGYDNLYIHTNSYEFYVEVEGVDPFLTRILTGYEDGHYPYGINSMSRFYIYFEISPFTNSEYVSFVLKSGFAAPHSERYFLNIQDVMSTYPNQTNVIQTYGTPFANKSTNNDATIGVAFTSVPNAVSINLGYGYAQQEYMNYETYSPRTRTLDPNKTYQFYLGQDAEGAYLTTDDPTLWTGKWYTWSSTNQKQSSAIVYFTTDRSPVLDGQVAFVSNITNPMTEANIRTFISAIDDYDGDITHLIEYVGGTYESNRVANTLVPNQSYTILYRVEDSSGNVSTLTVNVLVKDVTGPSFGIANPVRTVSYKDTFNVEGFKANLLVTDNYSTSANITITVIANTYTANKSVPGTYHVTYQATDQFGNSSTKVISVTVIDNIGPVFSGVSTVVKPVNSVVTANQIVAQVIASDEISGNVTSSIIIVTDNYTGNGATIGNYSIVVRATDAAGNTTDYTITVQVRDSLPPVFYVKDGYFINVEDTVTLSIGDIITILERTGQLVISSTTNYTVLVNEYSGNENMEGIYTVSIRFNSTNGTEVIKSVAINVINTNDPTGTINPEMTITDHLMDNWYWYLGGVVLLYIVLSKKTPKKRGK